MEFNYNLEPNGDSRDEGEAARPEEHQSFQGEPEGLDAGMITPDTSNALGHVPHIEGGDSDSTLDEYEQARQALGEAFGGTGEHGEVVEGDFEPATAETKELLAAVLTQIGNVGRTVPPITALGVEFAPAYRGNEGIDPETIETVVVKYFDDLNARAVRPGVERLGTIEVKSGVVEGSDITPTRRYRVHAITGGELQVEKHTIAKRDYGDLAKGVTSEDEAVAVLTQAFGELFAQADSAQYENELGLSFCSNRELKDLIAQLQRTFGFGS